MRKGIVLAIGFSLGSCSGAEGPEIARCEEIVIGKLKAPSTYKRVKVDTTDINAANPKDISSVTERWVSLSYDAVNSYNAPIRGSEMCRFKLRDGKASLDEVKTNDDIDVEPDQMVTPGLNETVPANEAEQLGEPMDDL